MTTIHVLEDTHKNLPKDTGQDGLFSQYHTKTIVHRVKGETFYYCVGSSLTPEYDNYGYDFWEWASISQR